MDIISARRFLTNSEIVTLEEHCNMFGCLFPKYFPDRSITRKIHELVFNVPKFAKEHNTVGLLSEQEVESKHASVNAELCSLPCVRSHAEK